MPEGSGQILAEKGVDEEDEGEHGEVGNHATRAFEGHEHADGGHHVVLRAEPAAAHGDGVIVQDEVAEGIQTRAHAYDVPDRGSESRSLFAAQRRIHEGGENQKKDDMKRTQLHGVHGREHGRVQLKQRERHADHGQHPGEGSLEVPGSGFAVLFLHESLRPRLLLCVGDDISCRRHLDALNLILVHQNHTYGNVAGPFPEEHGKVFSVV